MSELRTLLNTHPYPGKIDWIGLRPTRRADILEVEGTELTETGLEGDHHGAASPRAVTLIQAEHLPVIAALARADISPPMLRRNIVVSGINLTALRHAELQIGAALIKLTKPCAPCSRMEKTIGPGGYNAMRGHGGWYAEVVASGAIRLNDAIVATK